jgi:hypothetical protein
MQVPLFNPRQLYDRGHCGYAGGMDFAPVGKYVGQATAGPVWRAYCDCGWVGNWYFSQQEAGREMEEHRQTGNTDIRKFTGCLTSCPLILLLAPLAVARIAFRLSARRLARRAGLTSMESPGSVRDKSL